MRTYWILPNRDQRDEILASDGKRLIPLRQVLDPKLRPEGFSHGVPAEVLERCRPEALAEVLFAQSFPDWNGGKHLFSVSTPAGHDSSGRIVHLGLLFVLEPYERPRFELSCAGLSEEDQEYARHLIQRLASPPPGDSWAQSVRELSGLPAGRRPATNVALERSVVPFYSLYGIGPGGLTRKAASWRKSLVTAIVVIILLILFAVGVWFSAHAHGQSFSAVQTGVVIWRFS